MVRQAGLKVLTFHEEHHAAIPPRRSIRTAQSIAPYSSADYTTRSDSLIPVTCHSSSPAKNYRSSAMQSPRQRPVALPLPSSYQTIEGTALYVTHLASDTRRSALSAVAQCKVGCRFVQKVGLADTSKSPVV